MHSVNSPLLYVRATLFWIGFTLSTLLVGVTSIFLVPFSHKTSYKILLPWTHFNIWWIEICCGVEYNVLGQDNIDLMHNGILLINHQSNWETLFIPTIFPSVSWVVKEELFKIPFFGWALASIKPIAIDRKGGRSAIDQIKTKGKNHLDAGRWVGIFPEGTRVNPGETERYRMGGALLADYCAENAEDGAEYLIYPVAHNAGQCWPRQSYVKLPGTITVSIGEPFSVAGLDPGQVNDKAKEWIEAEIEKMPPAVT